ncbi:uncharacterized protein LOC119431190 isoform X2 [Dermacentor silvarum]|uniref:uncharacterized protein LOC119431190 isoform X2 n=1 Tax=Dermacentor silvarum TaxID=543639 RepID=UPI0021018907|nr:uncharacterized protein LOC119431190 isoform X2 [Dermacentor silvarum]
MQETPTCVRPWHSLCAVAMPDDGRRALHRVCDSVSGVNWRPTRFADDLMLTRYACCVCHVIPSTTIVLPCCHALCEQCQAGSVVQDGGSVCPLDAEPFCEDECQKWQLPERKKQNLKAYCWNEAHGCNFVGPLAALLRHFEEECAFHTFPCQQCGESVPNSQLAAHYIGGCSKGSWPGGATVVTDDVAAARKDVAEPRRNTYEDDISTLQSQVNELTQAARIQGAQLEELNAALAASLESLNGNVALAAEKFSEIIGEASQTHQRMLSWKAEERSLAKESEGIGRASRSDAETPWREETRDILRNLEICARESLSFLECIYRVLKKPDACYGTIQVFPVPPRIDNPTAGMDDSCSPSCVKVKESVYLAFVSNPRRLLKTVELVATTLHRRGAWCRVCFGLLPRPACEYGLGFYWHSEQGTISNMPCVVRVSVLHKGGYIVLPLKEIFQHPLQYTWYSGSWDGYIQYGFAEQMTFEIVVRD